MLDPPSAETQEGGMGLPSIPGPEVRLRTSRQGKGGRNDKSSKDGIPADTEEIEGAGEEGTSITYSRGVREIVGENGKFKAIKSPRCISVFDENGFNPQFEESDEMYIEGAADAMQEGATAAESIDRYIRGVDLKADREKGIRKG